MSNVEIAITRYAGGDTVRYSISVDFLVDREYAESWFATDVSVDELDVSDDRVSGTVDLRLSGTGSDGNWRRLPPRSSSSALLTLATART